MFKGKIKKFIVGASLALVVGVSAATVGCGLETSRPRAKVTVWFGEEEYNIEYTLYRDMYPQTVRHFIELADEGFYDDMLIHDFDTNDWITGAYAYNADDFTARSESGSTMSEYLESYSKENAYYELFNAGKLTPSVYSDVGYKLDKNGNAVVENGNYVQVVNKDYALPFVMGEFYNNINQEYENGGDLKAEYGCLKMIYYKKDSEKSVYVTPTKDQIIGAKFKNNCATSVFAMQTGTGASSYSSSDYCVFGKVKDTEAFDNFVDDVKEYFENNYGATSSSYTLTSTVPVDVNDSFSDKDEGKEESFKVTKTPIIIKSVKITKY